MDGDAGSGEGSAELVMQASARAHAEKDALLAGFAAAADFCRPMQRDLAELASLMRSADDDISRLRSKAEQLKACFCC